MLRCPVWRAMSRSWAPAWAALVANPARKNQLSARTDHKNGDQPGGEKLGSYQGWVHTGPDATDLGTGVMSAACPVRGKQRRSTAHAERSVDRTEADSIPSHRCPRCIAALGVNCHDHASGNELARGRRGDRLLRFAPAPAPASPRIQGQPASAHRYVSKIHGDRDPERHRRCP
jgi:hypothetical protein